jgi:hypothetical protein
LTDVVGADADGRRGAIAATFSGVFEHRDQLPFRIKISRSPIQFLEREKET